MSTTGVKRVGKGYQSDNKAPVSYTVSTLGPKVPTLNLNLKRAFNSTRKPMPPPVSSDDILKRRSSFCGNNSRRSDDVVDEFGMVGAGCVGGQLQGAATFPEATHTVGTMKRAFKAIVTGKRS